jgi:hypothetical protein
VQSRVEALHLESQLGEQVGLRDPVHLVDGSGGLEGGDDLLDLADALLVPGRGQVGELTGAARDPDPDRDIRHQVGESGDPVLGDLVDRGRGTGRGLRSSGVAHPSTL